MAAIYNFTQVPLTLPLQAAVKNRHGRRVIRGEEKEEKRIFFFFRKKGRNFENISIYTVRSQCHGHRLEDRSI